MQQRAERRERVGIGDQVAIKVVFTEVHFLISLNFGCFIDLRPMLQSKNEATCLKDL